jgi:hypothetical protein
MTLAIAIEPVPLEFHADGVARVGKRRRFRADENFNSQIVRGVIRQNPNKNIDRNVILIAWDRIGVRRI